MKYKSVQSTKQSILTLLKTINQIKNQDTTKKPYEKLEQTKRWIIKLDSKVDLELWI